MNKELLAENRSRILFAVFSLIALIVIGSCTQGIMSMISYKNDKDIQLVLDGLTYSEESANDELAALQELTYKTPLTFSTQGKLYRALTEVSYMTGNNMLYNQYIAYALFYLERSHDETSVIYLTNKYIGLLYANGCYESATEVLKKLAQKCDLSALSPNIRAEYYLSCADVAQMMNVDASGYLYNANAAIKLMPDDGNRKLNQAKSDILTARNYIQNGNFEQAEAVMSGYSETDDFGLGENQVYVVCDYRIPYYEITAKLALNRQDYSVAYTNVDKYISACNYYQFRTMKLRMLQYVVSNYDIDISGETGKYIEMEKEVITENLAEMTNEYGRFLLSNIDDITMNLSNQAQRQIQIKYGITFGFIAVYIIILLCCSTLIFMDYINKDSLTQLNNRKKYQKMMNNCEQKGIPYCLIVIDIDDFKKINDTFGHAQGDIILRKIADVLRKFSKPGITSYRYGGEEMCMVFMRISENDTRETAEKIRSTIEKETSNSEMRVTISGGIGVSLSGENVFRFADKRLYEAKRNGKNQIR